MQDLTSLLNLTYWMFWWLKHQYHNDVKPLKNWLFEAQILFRIQKFINFEKDLVFNLVWLNPLESNSSYFELYYNWWSLEQEYFCLSKFNFYFVKAIEDAFEIVIYFWLIANFWKNLHQEQEDYFFIFKINLNVFCYLSKNYQVLFVEATWAIIDCFSCKPRHHPLNVKTLSPLFTVFLHQNQ